MNLYVRFKVEYVQEDFNTKQEHKFRKNNIYKVHKVVGDFYYLSGLPSRKLNMFGTYAIPVNMNNYMKTNVVEIMKKWVGDSKLVPVSEFNFKEKKDSLESKIKKLNLLLNYE